MTEPAIVKQVSDNGRFYQWGSGLLFEQHGQKKRLKKGVSKSIIFILTPIILLVTIFRGENEIKLENRIATPTQVDQQTIHFGLKPLESATSADAQAVSKRTKKNNNEISPLLGPLILRPQDSVLIPPGTFVKAVLLTGATNGRAKAELVDPILLNGETMVSQGAILLGTGSSGEERLTIHFDKLVLPDSSVIKIFGNAHDSSDQILGLKGSKVNEKTMKVVGGLGLGFLGGVSDGLQESQNVGGLEVRSPSMRNAMLNGLSRSAIDESKDLLNGVREQKTILEVPKGTFFYVLFEDNPQN